MSRWLTFGGVAVLLACTALLWPPVRRTPDLDEIAAAANGAGLVVTNEPPAELIEPGFFVSRQPLADVRRWRKGEADQWDDVCWVGPNSPRLAFEPGPSFRYWGAVAAVGDGELLDSLEALFR